MTDPRKDKRVRRGLIPLLVALRLEAKRKAAREGKPAPDDEHDDDRR
ncbi:MAG: hypothetical protein V7672_04345 [Brevundimonas sp.]|jgi:hypothetical protein